MAIPANQALLNMDADLLDFLTQSLNFTLALCNCLLLMDTTTLLTLLTGLMPRSASTVKSRAPRQLTEVVAIGLRERRRTFRVLPFISLSVPWKEFKWMLLSLMQTAMAIPGKLGFDPVRPDDVVSPLDGASISKVDWAEFYPDAEEQLPRWMPTPHGAAVLTRAYVDANHAGNLANRRSHTGILIYINNSPVLWYSKRQNTVETSSFGSEFVALHIAVEMVEALRYKLRCFGVPLDGPTEVLCDNRFVDPNSSVPASILNKCHNAIC